MRLKLEDLPSLEPQDVEDMTKEVTTEEVWVAVKYMKPFKASCPNGFQPFFLKKYWDLVGDTVFNVVKGVVEEGYFVEVSKRDQPDGLG